MLPVTALGLADEIVKLLKKVTIRAADVARMTHQLQAPKGHEERIVEGMLRCVITNGVQQRYGVEPSRLPSCINSSHRTTQRACMFVGHEHGSIDWAWPMFRCANPGVDSRERKTGGKPGPHRADLFLIARGREIVSVEFKYIRPGAKPSVGAVVEQMRRYRQHAASILVVYVEEPAADDLFDCIATITERLSGQRVAVVTVRGPRVILSHPRGGARV